MSTTVRGQTKVRWKPDYTLTLESPSGTTLNVDTDYTLLATLTHTTTGNPVAGRRMKLATSPTDRTGDGFRGFSDENGELTITVSNPSVEAVQYTATLIPTNVNDEPTITGTVTINWGGVICSSCNGNIGGGTAEIFGDPSGVQWFVTYDVVTASGASCEINTTVTHCKAHVKYIPNTGTECDVAEPGFGIPDADVKEVLCDYMEPDDDLSVIQAEMQAEADAFLATLALDPC